MIFSNFGFPTTRGLWAVWQSSILLSFLLINHSKYLKLFSNPLITSIFSTHLRKTVLSLRLQRKTAAVSFLNISMFFCPELTQQPVLSTQSCPYLPGSYSITCTFKNLFSIGYFFLISKHIPISLFHKTLSFY